MGSGAKKQQCQRCRVCWLPIPMDFGFQTGPYVFNLYCWTTSLLQITLTRKLVMYSKQNINSKNEAKNRVILEYIFFS